MKKFLIIALAFIMTFAASGCILMNIYNEAPNDSSVKDSSLSDSSVEDSSVEDSSAKDSSEWEGWTDFY